MNNYSTSNMEWTDYTLYDQVINWNREDSNDIVIDIIITD